MGRRALHRPRRAEPGTHRAGGWRSMEGRVHLREPHAKQLSVSHFGGLIIRHLGSRLYRQPELPEEPHFDRALGRSRMDHLGVSCPWCALWRERTLSAMFGQWASIRRRTAFRRHLSSTGMAATGRSWTALDRVPTATPSQRYSRSHRPTYGRWGRLLPLNTVSRT